MDGNRNGTPQQNTVTLTPGTDFLFNFRNDQNAWARHGNDTILSFDPAAPIPTPPRLKDLKGSADQFNWNILLGDFLDESLTPELFKNPQLTGKSGRDKFILGDWRQPYYLDNFALGLQQQAIVADFQPGLDTIQLHGSKEDYVLFPFLLAGTNPQTGQLDVINGKALAWKGIKPGTRQRDFDIIAFFPDVPPGPGLPAEGLPLPDIDLNGSYFQFVGTTPPPKSTQSFVKQLGTNGLDAAFSVATDPDGNVYVVGSTTGSLGGANQGSYDIWTAKYDKQGNQLWIKQFGTPEADLAWDIKTFVADDGQVNFYLTGSTVGSLAAQSGGQPNEGYQDIWIARFDGEGNLTWIQQNPQPLPGPEIDNSLQIDVDKHGNLYQSGVTVEALPSGSLAPVQDYSWVAKYNPAGALQWFNGGSAFSGAGTNPVLESTDQVGFDETYGVAVSTDGSTYATGFTQNNLGGSRIGVYDVWLSKFDDQGKQEWVTKFGTENYDFSWGVDTDSHNNAYVAGWTRGDLGGKNAGPNPTTDNFIAKYNSQGQQEWVKQFGTSGDDGLFLGGITIDSHDNIYVSGFTDANLGGENQGYYDTWVAKYNTHGDQIWVQQFGSDQLDFPGKITADDFGNLFVTGYTLGSLGAANKGAVDAWIAKLDTQTGKLENFNGNKPVPQDGDAGLYTPGKRGQHVKTTFPGSDRTDPSLLASALDDSLIRGGKKGSGNSSYPAQNTLRSYLTDVIAKIPGDHFDATWTDSGKLMVTLNNTKVHDTTQILQLGATTQTTHPGLSSLSSTKTELEHRSDTSTAATRSANPFEHKSNQLYA
jgi:Beta-propeller repeat